MRETERQRETERARQRDRERQTHREKQSEREPNFGYVPYARTGVRHKQVCTRVDSEGQKTTVP